MKYVDRKKAIVSVSVILAVIIMILIWPAQIIRLHHVAKSDEVIERESDPISVEYNMTQMFEGIGGELTSVDLYVSNDMSDQIMTFRMYDENHEQIYEQFVSVSPDFIPQEFLRIPIRYDIEDGKEYSFIVEGLTQDLYLAYEDRSTTTSPVNSYMAYGGAEVPEYCLVVRYNYASAFNWWQVMLSAIVLAGLCVLIWWLTKKMPDKQVKMRTVLQLTVNPAVVILALVAFYIMMVKRLFGMDTKNNAFLTIGIWMLLAIPAYAVNFGQVKTKITSDIVKKINIGGWLRSIGIAMVLWYCYDYMNGLYDISHAYSTSKLLVAFGIFIIMTFNKKELLLIPNAIWLVVGPIIGYFYHKPQIGVNELDELYKLNAYVIVVAGFVVINIVYNIIRLVKKQIGLKKVDKRFAIPFAVFAVGICALANTRTWPFLLVGICLVLVYRLVFADTLKNFLPELCAGVILNFYMMVWFSLNHRPYYFYQFYRYNMGFHTVTVTAYYLSMVLCAAWIRLYIKYREKKTLCEMLPRLFTFGMAGAYLVFTMSRTGFLSAGMMILFAVVAATLIYEAKGKRLKHATKLIVLLVCAVIYMFPVNFFLTNVMPRLANDPVVFDYEWREFSFRKGMPYASQYYMTIEQFISEFKRKIFNITPPDEIEYEVVIDPETGLETMVPIGGEEGEDDSLFIDAAELEEMANGRMDIFRSYISNWNIAGHKEMGAEMPDGEIAVHAHNTFLQVAHDHGIIFGIFFGLFIGYVIVLSLLRTMKNKANTYDIFVPVVVVGFSMAGLVEWILHPCNPFGLCMFIAMMALFTREKDSDKA